MERENFVVAYRLEAERASLLEESQQRWEVEKGMSCLVEVLPSVAVRIPLVA